MVQFIINPFTGKLDAVGSESGTPVVGPGSSTAGDIAIFADTSGAVLADSGVAFPIPVAKGGTGDTTLTSHGVVVGQATSPVHTTAAGTAGQVLQSGGASADPTYSTATYPASTAQGDLLISSAANTLTSLAKNTTASRYLSNTGTNNNPAWAQINATNGLTGTLPLANGGTNSTSYVTNGIVTFNGTALATAANAQIDSSNIYTNISQPAFYAYLNTATPNVTGDNTPFQIIFDTVTQNRTTEYNVSTGTFTATKTAAYLFITQVTLNNLLSAHTGGFIKFLGAGFFQTMFFNPGVLKTVGASGIIDSTATFNMSYVVFMTPGATLQVFVQISGATKTVGIQENSSGLYTSLSGFLLS